MFELSAGQGSALSGFFTGIGAIMAVFLAQHIFKGRISDLKSAVGETENLVKSFKNSVDTQLNDVKEKFQELNAVTSAIQEGLSKTQAAVLERAEEGGEDDQPKAGDVAEADDLGRLKEAWHQVVDHLEGIAGSPNVDGRTRAKYGRIDRRSYYDLINALDADHRLGGRKEEAAQAAEAWYSSRRRREVPKEKADRMEQLAKAVLEIPIP